jgi:hypothetical protein
MKKFRPSILIFILLLLFFIGSLVLFFLLFTLHNRTDENTVSYTATVESVEIKQSESNTSLLIHTQEYSNALILPKSVEIQMDLEKVSQLKNGETITFRIEKMHVEEMNNADLMMIVSLKTDSTELLTLEQYNQYIEPSTFPSKIATLVLSTILLIGCAVSLYYIKKGRK